MTTSTSTDIDGATEIQDPRLYECVILYPYPIGQKEEADLLKEIEGYFAEVGAKLVSKDKWGQRGLAYAIKGFSEGNFIVYYFEMHPGKVKEVDQQLCIAKNLLRHMFVKPPKNYQILKYSDVYETWLKERESVEDKRSREKEEQLREQVAKKAKRQVKRVEEKKKETTAAPAMSEEVLTEKLEKLISDDQIDI